MSELKNNIKKGVVTKITKAFNRRFRKHKPQFNLEKMVGSLRETGVWFDGIPMMMFDERDSNWNYFMQAIISPFNNRVKTVLKLKDDKSQKQEQSYFKMDTLRTDPGTPAIEHKQFQRFLALSK